MFIRIFKTARGTEQSSCTYCTVRTIYLSDVMIIDKIVMYDPHSDHKTSVSESTFDLHVAITFKTVTCN